MLVMITLLVLMITLDKERHQMWNTSRRTRLAMLDCFQSPATIFVSGKDVFMVGNQKGYNNILTS